MTSNVGSQKIMDYDLSSKESFAKLEVEMLEVLRQHFRPEFLNRIDDIVIFDRIHKETLHTIVDVQLSRVARQIKDSRDITLRFDKSARDMLAEDGYDPAFGARPLKRLIQKRILDPLALELIDGRVHDGDTIDITAKDGTAVFTKK